MIALPAAVLETYARDGAVLLPGLLDAPTMARVARAVEEARHAPDPRSTEVAAMAGAGRTIVRDYASRLSPALRELLADGPLGEIGAALMQAPSAQLVLDQVFYKEAGPIVPTPWHQDTPFLRVRGEQLVRLWVCCDPSPRALTVQVVRGSHRWNVVWGTQIEKTGAPRRQGQWQPDDVVGDHAAPPPPDVRAHRDSFDILGWDVMPGDVLAFQGNMLHGTDGHPGHSHPRRALAVLLGGPQLAYHRPTGKAFPPPGGPREIPEGAPIGAHPEAFPYVWKSAQAAETA